MVDDSGVGHGRERHGFETEQQDAAFANDAVAIDGFVGGVAEFGAIEIGLDPGAFWRVFEVEQGERLAVGRKFL